MPHHDHLEYLVSLMDGLHIKDIEVTLKKEFKSTKVVHNEGELYFSVSYRSSLNFKKLGTYALRGTIFELDEEEKFTGKVLCLPFYKFFNSHERYAEDIPFDWDSAVASRKEDGSLMKLFYHRDEWKVATNNTPNAFAQGSTSGNTFGNSFIEAAEATGLQWDKLVPHRVYCFELVTSGGAVVQYKEKKIFHLLTRCMKTLHEVEAEDEEYIGVPRPEVLKVDEALLSAVRVPHDDDSEQTDERDSASSSSGNASVTPIETNADKGMQTNSENKSTSPLSLTKRRPSPKEHIVIRALKQEADNYNHTDLEGFVVKDKHGYRFKVKSQAYTDFVNTPGKKDAVSRDPDHIVLMGILTGTIDDKEAPNQEAFNRRVEEMKIRISAFECMCNHATDSINEDLDLKAQRGALNKTIKELAKKIGPEYQKVSSFAHIYLNDRTLEPNTFLLNQKKSAHRLSLLPSLAFAKYNCM